MTHLAAGAVVEEQSSELDLREYGRILWRHKTALVASTLACVLLALLLSARQDKVYEATTQILLTSASNSVGGSGTVDDTQIATEIAVVESAPVAAAVDTQLGADAALVNSVSAARVGDTRVIEVSATSSSPEVAQRAADATADTYVSQRLDRALATVNSLRGDLQQRITATRTELDDVDSQIAAESAKTNPSQTVLAGLTSRRDILTAQLLSLQQKLGDLQTDSTVDQAGAEVLSTAALPTVPVSPRPKRNAVLGAMLGLILGVAIAFGREALSGKANREDDIARVLPGVPILARIPTIEGMEARHGEGALFAIDAPASQAAEAVRLLNVNLQFATLDRNLRSIMVTSASSQEGKTTVAANLAATVARTGKNVVLVDCDLRRPGIERIMSLQGDTGLTTVLLGRAKLEDTLQSVPVEGFRALQVLTAGVPPPNPAELLSTRQVAELLEKLTANADLVVIDVPPVAVVADALVLSRSVDGVLLVARLGTSRPKAIAQADGLLRRADAHVVGVVVNGANASSEPYFVPEDPTPRRDRRFRRGHSKW